MRSKQAACACAVEGCGRPSAPRSALCWGHLRRRTKGKPLDELRPRGRSPWRALEDARVALQMAAEQDVERARKRYESALLRWGRARAEAALRKAGVLPG